MNNESELPDALKITGSERPHVPVFTCIVYVCGNEDGTVSARVANLAGIQIQAATERDALGKVSREFKSQVIQAMEDGVEVEWIEPPEPAADNERVRSIPVHL